MSKFTELIRSIACTVCQALGGKPVEQPSDVGEIEGSSPRTSKHTPSSRWLVEELPTYWADKPLNKPTYNIDDLIQHLQFRIGIHETYWGLVEDDPARWSGFGSVEFHQWAIEGYQNACLYLRRIVG